MVTNQRVIDELVALTTSSWRWKVRQLKRLVRDRGLDWEQVDRQTAFVHGNNITLMATLAGGRVTTLSYLWDDASRDFFDQLTITVVDRLHSNYGVVRSRMMHRRIWALDSGATVELARSAQTVMVTALQTQAVPQDWPYEQPATAQETAARVAQVAHTVVHSDHTLTKQPRWLVPLERSLDAVAADISLDSYVLPLERMEPPFDLAVEGLGWTTSGQASYERLTTVPFLLTDWPGHDYDELVGFLVDALSARLGKFDELTPDHYTWNRSGWKVRVRPGDGFIKVELTPDDVTADSNQPFRLAEPVDSTALMIPRTPAAPVADEVQKVAVLFEKALNAFAWNQDTLVNLAARITTNINLNLQDETGRIELGRDQERYAWFLYADLARPGRYVRLSHAIDPDQPGGRDWVTASQWCLRRWGQTYHEDDNQLLWEYGSGVVALRRMEDGTLLFAAVPNADYS